MPNDTPVLQCASCGHQNEPERVYCHNCGQKLDRSLLPKSIEASKESPEAVRRRVKKMMDVKGRGAFKQNVKTFFTVIAFSAVIAAGYLYFQTPDGVPPKKSDFIPNNMPGDLWQRLVESPQAMVHEFQEEEINYFLRQSLKPADSSIPMVKFERAFVRVNEQTITVTVERSVYDMVNVYNSTEYAPRNGADGVTFEPVGVYFGKLGLDPRIPSAAGLGLGGLQDALKKELAHFNRLKSVTPKVVSGEVDGAQVRKGFVKLETKTPQ